MPKMNDQMRCSCGSAIFSHSGVTVTLETGEILEMEGARHLKCLVCLRDFLHEGGASLIPVTQDIGKKRVRDLENSGRKELRGVIAINKELTKPELVTAHISKSKAPSSLRPNNDISSDESDDGVNDD